MISAHDALASLTLLPPKDVAALAAAGLTTPGAVLEHLPRRYEDRRRFDAFPNQPSPLPVCLRGTVIDAALRGFGHGRRFYEAIVMDGSGGLGKIWSWGPGPTLVEPFPKSHRYDEFVS